MQNKMNANLGSKQNEIEMQNMVKTLNAWKSDTCKQRKGWVKKCIFFRERKLERERDNLTTFGKQISPFSWNKNMPI